MPFSAKVFIPKSLIADPKGLARAVENGLDGAAAGALVDFKVTTATWQHQPAFDVSSPNEGSRVVGTDDEIYGYVSSGTKPHIIVAHGKGLAFNSGGFRPKSRVRVIGSNAGSKGGSPIVRPVVHHPGTDAREFDEAIAEKWTKQLPIVMQRSIDAEVT
jgi:hypothetical protein